MKKFFLLLMPLAVIVACEPKNPDDKPGGNGGDDKTAATVVRVGTSTLNFEAVGAEPQTLKVYADGAWTSVAPDWVTVDPASGSGTVTVTVSVSDNESVDGRMDKVVFAPELTSTTNVLTVQQKGDNKVTIKTGAAFAEWLSNLTVESLDEARIAADIDMSGVDFKSAEGFAGILDGGGFAIKNLKSTGPLFRVNRGTLSGIVIDASCSFEPDTCVFGAIVTRNEGVVRDCINKGTVTRTIAPTSSKSNLIAGVIGMSTVKEGTISGCKNYGKVSLRVTDDGKFTTQGVAGVVAFALEQLVDCENYGEISLTGGYHTNRACPARDPSDPGNIETGEFYNKKVGSSLGGVAAYPTGGLTRCKNEGKVSWTESKLEGMNTSPARIFTGGVAGTYYGEVSDCTNSGAVVVKTVSSNGADFTGQNHQHCIGGVFGAVNNPSDDSPSKNRGVKISGCSNSGTVSMESNASKSWTHIGGVVGWPASDNDNTNPNNWGVMSSCTNSGALTVSGTAKFRCGGVVGATPYMENCSNTGSISIKGSNQASEVGGVAGRHWGYAQTLKNCSSKADVKSDVVLESVSGFIGWIANNNSATVEGGSVSGSLNAPAGSSAGMLAGAFGGSNVAVTLGSSVSPIEVSGTVNGTAITSENASTLLWGGGYDAAVHSVNYVIK